MRPQGERIRQDFPVGYNMINIYVNGEALSISSFRLTELLEKAGILHKEGIAVAVNECVIPRSDWEDHRLSDGDIVIIITATQGG